MKYVIFGGGGFIGSTIADQLLKEGHSLRIFERPRVEPYRKFTDDESVEWITGDFQSKHNLHSAMEGTDGILHLVSTTLPKSSNEDTIYDIQTNVVSTLNMLDSMVELNIKKIVFISSGGTVYGRPQQMPIPETHPTEPEVSYGISKLTIEKYLYLYSQLHGIEPITLRVANPYGERQRIETAQGAVAAFINRAVANNPIEIWGDGSVTRDYIYIKDLADAFVKALRYTGKQQVFNLGSGTGTSLNELINVIEKIVKKPIERTYKPGRPFDVPVNVLDCSLAERELGWSAQHNLADGLTSTIAWYLSQIDKKPHAE
ncbi:MULTISPECIES: NAD-dependent epimerase/dehydratase family protein [unclassified Pseudomonas]|uniref:NAD-dependent epimerase/dehydratase family protein n=2 Tax=Pseudomonas TaxID=286 RepID=UPI001F1A2BAC|nr:MULTISPECIES: NAD-dependent epimerase/dehydratase family protein [unclassified Pseudomonas]MCF5233280.1 NAD-dependent epimerase/dehydratase family protein [Pseudomonas sp. PA-5-4H]MCF5236090.1 NAD-dependent epimerase/dehydratase family protein [Pseudomonas sp. PA-5-4G]MCF5250250.1 NAD-dependent epimerase/dehydratase family protein [Pseudomonas sp. PA-5-4B]MCF5262974.1 NAD-dependent epimerase/dehydratase family protein [Pseudomonas sp. PA-5-4A]